MNRWRRSALAISLLFASVTPTVAANLVTDPGFENCTTVNAAPPLGWTGTAACNPAPHSETWAAIFGAPADTLSQSIATTPGAIYDFSFWVELIATGTAPASTFTASFGGDQVLNLSNITGFGYNLEDFTVTAAAANTTISFTGVTGAARDAFLLDDVSVTLESVPAPALGSGPAGFAVLGLALALFPLRRLRTRHDWRNRLRVA
jgi:hypothetical protein